jgi:hypothetical protein
MLIVLEGLGAVWVVELIGATSRVAALAVCQIILLAMLTMVVLDSGHDPSE